MGENMKSRTDNKSSSRKSKIEQEVLVNSYKIKRQTILSAMPAAMPQAQQAET